MIAPATETDVDRHLEPISAAPPPWDRRAVLHQRWTQLGYFHWAYEPAAVQRLLPVGTRVDTFDGAAWVGLIPFEMRDVRFGPTPAIPRFGSFIEINVRTYVTDPLGRRAVWFFSLDVPRAPVVAVARSVFGLPYRWSHAEHTVDGDRHRYRTRRRWPIAGRGGADIRFHVGATLADRETTELDDFLCARWSLIARRRGRLWRSRVDHPRWPLHHVDRIDIDQTLVEAAGLPTPSGAPHARYSPGVDVRVSWFERVPDDRPPPRRGVSQATTAGLLDVAGRDARVFPVGGGLAEAFDGGEA
jgi:hypothetical protein